MPHIAEPTATGLRLGLDAGGSFTDAVLLDGTGAVLAWAKAPTTPREPSIGVAQALAGLPREFLPRVGLAGLATTFATNALVEGRGARAGLVLVGYDPPLPPLPGSPPLLAVAGGHDYWGKERQPLDLEDLAARLPGFAAGLDAVAVAAVFSVRNPDHELAAARLVAERTGLPVVCGHRLSGRLDVLRRATTAWWNARLISLLTRLVDATEAVLAGAGVRAPLMVVRGDGTLMSAATARERPVETLLSGPAASVLGAGHLSGLADGLVVDMGGTTTDLALQVGGRVAVDPVGARGGPWQTHVEAARIRTVGLGGDSAIAWTGGRVEVGPRRIEPLCFLAHREPRALALLRAAWRRPLSSRRANPSALWVAASPDAAVPEILRRGPLSEALLLEDPDRPLSLAELENLEERGLAARSGLTPTDLRVATGHFDLGNAEASRLGLALWARRAGLSEAAFAEAVEEEVRRRLCTEVAAFADPRFGPPLAELWEAWFPRGDEAAASPVRVALALTTPVLGGGAPAAAFLPEAFRRLDARCVLPEAFPVSTAVGAVVGTVEVTLRGEVHPVPAGTFLLYTPEGTREFADHDQAVAEGRAALERLVGARLAGDGVAEPLLRFAALRETAPLGSGGGELHLRTDLALTGSGRVGLGRRGPLAEKTGDAP
ncbi:MAG: hydantoinase/oxoprolinase N-terminal domain-containing protein [Deferrisomatales bacterium]